MQIRAGNRQDESAIRQLVFACMEDIGAAPDPEEQDSDLKNIEASYFWHDGICIVAEDEGTIAGMAAGRPLPPPMGDMLDLCRLVVAPEWRRRGVARQLINTVRFFAGNMGYREVVIQAPAPSESDALARLGFERCHPQERCRWRMAVPETERSYLWR